MHSDGKILTSKMLQKALLSYIHEDGYIFFAIMSAYDNEYTYSFDNKDGGDSSFPFGVIVWKELADVRKTQGTQDGIYHTVQQHIPCTTENKISVKDSSLRCKEVLESIP